MANITIQNLEVESTALNQVSSGEMEKVVGGIFYAQEYFGYFVHKVVDVYVLFGLLEVIHILAAEAEEA